VLPADELLPQTVVDKRGSAADYKGPALRSNLAWF
jgi:hypothetical protein